jgi:signal transduction histidine kinase
MRLLPWPRTLAGRTAVVLLAGLALVQAAGLFIHALDRVDLQRLAQVHDAAQHTMNLYRSLALLPQADRAAALAAITPVEDQTVRLAAGPPDDPLQPCSIGLQRQLVAEMQVIPVPVPLRPRDTVMLGGFEDQMFAIGLLFPEGDWLDFRIVMPPPRPWHSFTFLVAFVMMTAAAALMSLWAVRRLTRPVAVLAQAAERLGRDVNAPPLPETGPEEITTAAIAFNTMAERIRRFVQDRTLMLTAIGHDLRTPITRLRLRAEFIDDEGQRARMLSDLDDMEAMVAATLAFGRDAQATEAISRVDLAELLRTIIDEAGDARPDLAGRLTLDGPEHLAIAARPLALKRALTNLVGNAASYGGSARVSLAANPLVVTITIDDDGPGIPANEVERMFQPFQRLEASRSRETGGVGLGLPIARDILRAHGGDVALENRGSGGLRVRVTLPG